MTEALEVMPSPPEELFHGAARGLNKWEKSFANFDFCFAFGGYERPLSFRARLHSDRNFGQKRRTSFALPGAI